MHAIITKFSTSKFICFHWSIPVGVEVVVVVDVVGCVVIAVVVVDAAVVVVIGVVVVDVVVVVVILMVVVVVEAVEVLVIVVVISVDDVASLTWVKIETIIKICALIVFFTSK